VHYGRLLYRPDRDPRGALDPGDRGLQRRPLLDRVRGRRHVHDRGLRGRPLHDYL